MKKKIVLIGAGSSSFGPSMFTDLYLSKVLEGSTIVLHDINKKKLEFIYDLLCLENERNGNKFNIEYTIERIKALNDADFVINSIEVGDRFSLWWQDYEIPKKCGSTQILGECGGPGGTFHAWRIILPIGEIVKDVEKVCPHAFFINFSNPLSRVCLAIKRITPNLKSIGLCHQIGFLYRHLPLMFNKNLEELKIKITGLNHLAFLMGLEDLTIRESLMPKFYEKAMNYFRKNEDRFEFSILTFKVYEQFGYFPYVGDNHLGEFLQFAEEFTNTQDMIDWIYHTDKHNKDIYDLVMHYYKRLKKGKPTRVGPLFKEPSGESAVPIIESIITNEKRYEPAVNIPNDGLVPNLPTDLILENSAYFDKSGYHGVKIGSLPKDLAAILRIEATIQDLCVEAVLKRSKNLAISCLALDPNVGSFEIAEQIFDEMYSLQKEFLPKFR